MRNTLTLILAFSIAACGGGGTAPEEPAPDVTITGGTGGSQQIDASQQSGGATVEGDVENLVVENEELVNTQCKRPAQKNFGMLERNGFKGPMCKKSTALRISKKRCERKNGFQTSGVCVIEWEGTQWRVRVLKER